MRLSRFFLLAFVGIALSLSSQAYAEGTNLGTNGGNATNAGTNGGSPTNLGTNGGSPTNLGTNGGSDTCGNAQGGQTIVNPLKFCSLEELLAGILDAVIKLGTVILTLALIWTGFLFVAARGNDEKIRSARTALMWTIIGGLILLGAKGIQEVITSTVGSLTS